jgi:hypothetical protein
MTTMDGSFRLGWQKPEHVRFVLNAELHAIESGEFVQTVDVFTHGLCVIHDENPLRRFWPSCGAISAQGSSSCSVHATPFQRPYGCGCDQIGTMVSIRNLRLLLS